MRGLREERINEMIYTEYTFFGLPVLCFVHGFLWALCNIHVPELSISSSSVISLFPAFSLFIISGDLNVR